MVTWIYKNQRVLAILEPITALHANRDRHSEICFAFRVLFTFRKQNSENNIQSKREIHSENYIRKITENYRESHSEIMILAQESSVYTRRFLKI